MASARNTGSLTVAMKALRRASRRATGTPGGAAKGLATVWRLTINRTMSRSRSVIAFSSTVGTSGNSSLRSVDMTRSTFRRLGPLTQSGRVALMEPQDQPQRPSSSPRSMASVMSLPPG